MSNENDYFRKIDQEAKEKLRKKLTDDQASAERLELARLHRHRCGKCGGEMNPRNFRGMEIEECADCTAVLLDPGELEALAGKDAVGVFNSFFTMFGSHRS